MLTREDWLEGGRGRAALLRAGERAALRMVGMSDEGAIRRILHEEVHAALKELGFDAETRLDEAVRMALAELDKLSGRG